MDNVYIYRISYYDVFDHLPQQRRLDENGVEEALKLKVNKKLLQHMGDSMSNVPKNFLPLLDFFQTWYASSTH